MRSSARIGPIPGIPTVLRLLRRSTVRPVRAQVAAQAAQDRAGAGGRVRARAGARARTQGGVSEFCIHPIDNLASHEPKRLGQSF